MATTWPQEMAWPTEHRKHAARLNKYLKEALLCIERSNDQPVPQELAKTMILGTLSLLIKLQNIPEISSIQATLQTAQTKAKADAEQTKQSLAEIKEEMRSTKTIMQQSLTEIQKNKTATREATEIGRTVMAMVREMKSTEAQGPQREIIVNIRDPTTIERLRAMNSRDLKAHVDRAIEQSGNEHINKTKITSTNQLKSGDLSIKTATAKDIEALRQFADDWALRLGNGTSVRVPTYGVLAHGIRTRTMDMSQPENVKTEILQDNKPFIPNAEIKHIGWLKRTQTAKLASSVIIEFTNAEDANKIIDEGLIWQGEEPNARQQQHVAFAHRSTTPETALPRPKDQHLGNARYVEEHIRHGARNAQPGRMNWPR
ncbi:hypothetical protein F5Y11DRAFT_361494 [Daldinia sp. FL1419]|nr:hypothetical protein F5Y11DRAFT_361494 [Daldinia sp. FL1419]